MKYAPRLESLESRTKNTTRIPIELRMEIERVASKEGCSMSWIVEQIILDWAGLLIEYKDSPKKMNGHARKNGRTK